MKPTKSCFPGLSSGSAAYRFVRYHGPHVDKTSLLEVAFIPPTPPPHTPFPPSLPTDKSKMTSDDLGHGRGSLWTTTPGHSLAFSHGVQDTAHRRYGLSSVHLLPSKIYPWMNSLFGAYWTIPGKTHRLLSYRWEFYAPLFQGYKASHVFISVRTFACDFAH